MDWLLHIWNQLPPEWQAILKWIFDKHLGDTIKVLGLIVTLPLWKRLWNWLMRRLSMEILIKRLSDYYMPHAIKSGIRYYIWPDCQNMDPTQLDEIRQTKANREALVTKIDDLLLDEDSEFKHVILLADTGMGKTSFLMNYFARHLKRWRRRIKMQLIPLSVPELKEKITKLPAAKRKQTILLLDAFDEDSEAIKDHVKRLREIVDWTRDYHRILITCRTQFFPRDEELPKDTEIVNYGPLKLGESGKYEFYKLYLSPFNKKQIKTYLKKRFPIWRYQCRSRAWKIIDQVKDLVARPLLLTYIDDLIDAGKNFQNSFQVYEALIYAWLKREERFVPNIQELLKFSDKLAVELLANHEKYPEARIPLMNLEPFAKEFNISLELWQLSSRSLLNRDAKGNYKFAHRSILEYLFARQVIDKNRIALNTSRLLWSEQIRKFLFEKLGDKGNIYIYLPVSISFSGGNYAVQKTGQSFELAPFQLAIYPITNLQYELFNPKHQRCQYSDQDDQPVVNVSWEDAVKYCEWLSQQTGKTYRLPTEAEWEYAASGGGKRDYPWGNEEPTPERANYDASKIGKTTPVGSYPAGRTPEGLFDMAGNVWEWCQDWYDKEQKYRVLRGGCFDGYFLYDLRGSSRSWLFPHDRGDRFGFRVVCVA